MTDRQIILAIKENDLSTVEQVTNYTKAGGGCESCHSRIEEIIEESRGEIRGTLSQPPATTKLSNIQKIKLIEEIFERDIKPSLRADGGDIDLIDVDGNKVIVALRGLCTDCPSAEHTLKDYVETKLKECISIELTVEEEKT